MDHAEQATVEDQAFAAGGANNLIPTSVWALVGAAALTAGALSARRRTPTTTRGGSGSLVSGVLPTGGSERATVGNSRLVLINDQYSPTSYLFTVDVPPGGHTGINPDGSATVYDADGNPVTTIAKPWAYDSLGRPQNTWYTTDTDGNLVQHVQASPDALYPILADPTPEESNSQAWIDDWNGAEQGPGLEQQREEAQERSDLRDQGLAVTTGTDPSGTQVNQISDPETGQDQTIPIAETTPQYDQGLDQQVTESENQAWIDDWNGAEQGPGLEQQREQAQERSDLRDQGLAVTTGTDADTGAPTQTVTDPEAGVQSTIPTGPSVAEQAAIDNTESQSGMDAIVGGQYGPYSTPEAAQQTTLAQQRIRLRDLGYTVIPGTDPYTGAPISTIIDPTTGEKVFVPPTADLTVSQPGQEQSDTALVTPSRAATLGTGTAQNLGNQLNELMDPSGKHARVPASPGEARLVANGAKILGRASFGAGVGLSVWDNYTDWRDGRSDGGQALAGAGGAIGGGVLGGALAGGAVGSFAGPVGTAIGAGVGGLIGSELGKATGKWLFG